jgi:hypothetical protein
MEASSQVVNTRTTSGGVGDAQTTENLVGGDVQQRAERAPGTDVESAQTGDLSSTTITDCEHSLDLFTFSNKNNHFLEPFHLEGKGNLLANTSNTY